MKAKKQQGKRRPKRPFVSFLVVAFAATLFTSADREDGESGGKVIPNDFGIGALAFNGSPYSNVPKMEMRQKFFEVLDAHPDRELGKRLKEYFETHRAEIDFESKNFYRMAAGISGYSTAHMDMGIVPPLPILTIDTMIFDRNYTTLQNAYRIVTHEGYHLSRIMNGDMPERLIGEDKDDPYTEADIKLLYEDEVEAYRRECELGRNKPSYIITNDDKEDLCLGFYRRGIQALRDNVAKTYTEMVPSYMKHRDYILSLAAQPDAK